MASIKQQLQSRSWKKDDYLLSTDPTLFPVQRLIDIFSSDDFYWAKALSPEATQAMVNNSLCFGLFQTKDPQPGKDMSSDFIGFARCITDFVTFAYVTDVWVDSTRQGEGLGSWMVRCMQEVLEDMPDLRRSLLFTADWERSVPFYEKLMGMNLIEARKGEGLAIMERKGKGHPSYGRAGTSYN